MTTDYLKQAEQDTLAEILTWVREVVEGRGESISQMVVSVVLGCIPGVGQSIDVYNILRALNLLAHDSDDADNWLELVLCLIALVPLFGDALKNVFHMLRHGKTMARILDSLPGRVRGNIEKWFRELNWSAYTRDLIADTHKILDGIIDLLDTRIVHWILDKPGLRRLIAQFNVIKAKAQRKITEAMNSLESAHQHTMVQPLPNTTAHVPSSPGAPSKAPPGSSGPAPRRQPGANNDGATLYPEGRSTPPPVPVNRDLPANTGGSATSRQGQTSAQQRQSDRTQYRRSKVGVLGEHIADYYFARNKQSRTKVNNGGVLYEGWQSGHHGIDHVWFSQSLAKKYRISDTKGTNAPFHKKLETITQIWEVLEYGLEVPVEDTDESKIRNSVGNTKGDGKQMSHRWIAAKIKNANLTSTHHMLKSEISCWERVKFDPSRMECPYDRSLITVVGPNFLLHDRNANSAKGWSQTPAIGKCRKSASRHQIATEFVIPVNLLEE